MAFELLSCYHVLMIYAQIAVFTYTKNNNDLFTYGVPPELRSNIKVGQIVTVFFNKRKLKGLVIKITNEKPAFSTKDIQTIVEENPIPAHLIKIIFFLQTNCVSSLRQSLGTVIPFNSFSKNRQAKETKEKEIKKTDFHKLNPEQQYAFNEIKKSITEDLSKTFLLMGITGSGKTEVYLRAIEEVLNRGKQVIVLVPEISLTPQTYSVFESRFPGKIAVWHSKLKETEKFKTWQKIHNNEKPIVIGSRSAIFAPLKNLGLIVIDEEQENSFKQDQTPRYQTRTIALEIQKILGSAVILGSATPSLESYYYAKNDNFKMLNLTKRATKSLLPQTTIVDLRDEFKKGNKSIFSEILTRKIRETLAKKEQIVLFLNRRGASTFVLCRDCGFVFMCPNCDIPYIYHLLTNKLICHHCSAEANPPTTCPNCKGPYIKFFGTGTQKVENELNKLFPSARILRMDKDSTKKRDSHEKIYSSFKNHETDILIGTQMIAKGWDIENVSLVGIISADSTLFVPDFRAEERTFQLITQVSGRAGRGIDNPDNKAIKYAAKNLTRDFYDEELLIRKDHNYPPFVNLVKILYNNIVQKDALLAATKDKRLLETKFNVLGPIPSFIPKINNSYRYLLVLKLKESELNDFLGDYSHRVEGSIDIDPQNILL